MHPIQKLSLDITRRHFFRECGVGVGKIALASLLAETFAGRAVAAPVANAPGSPVNPLAPRRTHFAPRARRVIHLFMAGAPSHLDLFDYKPALARFEGKRIPPEVIGGQRHALIPPGPAAPGPPPQFSTHVPRGA